MEKLKIICGIAVLVGLTGCSTCCGAASSSQNLGAIAGSQLGNQSPPPPSLNALNYNQPGYFQKPGYYRPDYVQHPGYYSQQGYYGGSVY